MDQGLATDHGLEIAHHHGVGMGAEHRAEDVEGGAHVGDPVAQGLIDRIFERLRAGIHLHHLGAHEAHANDVELLPAHVLGTHVDPALETEERGCGRDRHPVLAGAGFGDHTSLPHVTRQQSLADGVVDLVRPGVAQILALEPDARTAEPRRQPAGRKEGSGTADVMLQQLVIPRLEAAIATGLAVGTLELRQRRHQGLGHKTSPVVAKVTAVVGKMLHGWLILPESSIAEF